MRTKFENVRPIRPGYDAALTISYGVDFWSAEQLDSGRLVAQFRQEVNGPVIATADSDAGTITRPSARTITLTVAAADTADMQEREIYFDLIRIADGAQRPVPGRWKWPVRATVTRDVQ